MTRPFAAAQAGLCIALLAAGCAGGPDKPKPTPLEPLAPQVTGKQVWNQRLGSVKFPLSVAIHEGTFTVAADDGTVMALRADDGQVVWRADVGVKLSAGVGSDGRFASVVTRDNELITLEAGRIKWRHTLSSRVATAPLVAGERVFVMGLDRSVQAFDVLDGRKLWSFQRPGDALALSRPGVLQPFKDTLLVGQGAKLVGLDPLRGTQRWEVTLATPRGTNEVERLADLVAPAARVGDTLCVRAFQAAVGCVNAERGSLVWARNAGGSNGVAADEQLVVAADAADRITAWRIADAAVAWTSDKLLYRELSAPLAVGQVFIVGDGEGMVHWLSREGGQTLLRLPTDGSPIAAAPVTSGLTLLMVTRDGGVFAFRPE